MIKHYTLGNKPNFANQEMVKIDESVLVGSTSKEILKGRILGKAVSHIVDLWIVDLGEEYSRTYPYQAIAVPHTCIIDE
jgi:hypothetical protein